MEKFWMVWNENGGEPIHRHTSLNEAKKEAERLATKKAGQKFVILESLEFCAIKNPIIWEETPDIPF